MNALPSMTVLDFCEWLKKQTQDRFHDNVDVYDLILNQDYNELLSKYAKEYLFERIIVRDCLHNFIDSKEFEKLSINARYDYDFPRRHDLRYSLQEFFFHIHYGKYEKAFERFLDHYCDEKEEYKPDSLESNNLVDSVRYYFKNSQGYPSIMRFMAPIRTELSLELDFLEWLMNNRGKRMDIDRMPLSVFEDLAEAYCNDTNRQSEDRVKLIKSFKGNNNVSISEKVKAVIPPDKANKLMNLGYIYNRYLNKKVSFRCFFLTRAKNSDEYKNFIKNYWGDLHEVSGDYLDIYYGEEDFGVSGHTIKNQMSMLPKNLSNKLPCLVLWKDDMSKAKAVDLEGLSDEEIVSMIEGIVDIIKNSNSLEVVVKEANKMADDYRQSKRPVNNFYVEENNGVMAGVINDSKINIHNETKEAFSDELPKAIEVINRFTEVESSYRESLIAILKEANEAIKKNNEKDQANCRVKFEGFMMGAGKAVSKIITKLSEFATIAGFFGITAETLSQLIK